jgi:hypothetical protein
LHQCSDSEPVVDPAVAAEEFKSEANSYYKKGDYMQAVELYSQAIGMHYLISPFSGIVVFISKKTDMSSIHNLKYPRPPTQQRHLLL